MKRKWTRGEKWLFGAPLLVGLAALALQVGPNAARRALGWPQSWKTTPGNELTSLVLSGNGEVLSATGQTQFEASTAHENGMVYVWNARTSAPVTPFSPLQAGNSSLTGKKRLTLALALSPDGQQIGFFHTGQKWALYDIATQRCEWRFSSASEITDAQWSPDGRFIALSNSTEVFIAAARDGHIQSRWKRDKGLTTFTGVNPRIKGLNTQDLSWVPNGSVVADIGNHQILLHRASDGLLLRRIKNFCPSNVAFSPDGKRLVVTCGVRQLLQQPNDNSGIDYWIKLRCFDTSTGVTLWELKGRQFGANVLSSVDDFCDAAFSPDGRTIAVYQNEDRRIFLIDSTTGEIQATKTFSQITEAIASRPRSLAFSSDSRKLYVRASDTVLVWDLK